MQIDVLIATHNRAPMLSGCIGSILESAAHPLFDVTITVVDNNSSDDTPHTVARLTESTEGRVRYLREPRLGKSRALNTGLNATMGEVVAFADDDQVMGPEWLSAIHNCISEGFDFASGPVYGQWESSPPGWYDDRLRGVLSLADFGPQRFTHQKTDFFSGGNAAVTRRALRQIGGLQPSLGKMAGAFSMCEDGELLLRLTEAGLRGIYDPAMRVRHFVPRERLTRRYFRLWNLGYGRSMSSVHRLHPLPVPHWFGIPRFLIRHWIESLPRMFASRIRNDLPGAFREELHLWFMLGYVKGNILSDAIEPAPGLNQTDRITKKEIC